MPDWFHVRPSSLSNGDVSLCAIFSLPSFSFTLRLPNGRKSHACVVLIHIASSTCATTMMIRVFIILSLSLSLPQSVLRSRLMPYCARPVYSMCHCCCCALGAPTVFATRVWVGILADGGWPGGNQEEEEEDMGIKLVILAKNPLYDECYMNSGRGELESDDFSLLTRTRIG